MAFRHLFLWQHHRENFGFPSDAFTLCPCCHVAKTFKDSGRVRLKKDPAASDFRGSLYRGAGSGAAAPEAAARLLPDRLSDMAESP